VFFYILSSTFGVTDIRFVRIDPDRKEERRVARISPRQFKGSVIFLCKLAITAVTAGAFLYL
jgi:hypothetical protein